MSSTEKRERIITPKFQFCHWLWYPGNLCPNTGLYFQYLCNVRQIAHLYCYRVCKARVMVT